MALLEKLSESCQRKKINAWLGSPGDWDPTPHRHRRHQSHSLTHFVSSFLTQSTMARPVQTKDAVMGINLSATLRGRLLCSPRYLIGIVSFSGKTSVFFEVLPSLPLCFPADLTRQEWLAVSSILESQSGLDFTSIWKHLP